MTKKELLERINRFKGSVHTNAEFRETEFIHLLLDFMEYTLRRHTK